MELKEFVKETLLSIVAGIREAQEVEGVGAFIVPQGVGVERAFPMDRGVLHSQRLLTTVAKFDIALTAEASEAKTGKGGVRIAVVNAGIEGQTSNRSTAVSRVEFSVPIVLPQSQREWSKEQAQPFKPG